MIQTIRGPYLEAGDVRLQLPAKSEQPLQDPLGPNAGQVVLQLGGGDLVRGGELLSTRTHTSFSTEINPSLRC